MEEESLIVTAPSGVIVSQEKDLAIVTENGEGSYATKGDAPSSDISEEASGALIASYKGEIQEVKQGETESREWACNAKNEDTSPWNAAEYEYRTMVMNESENSEVKMVETEKNKEKSELVQEVPENKIEEKELELSPGKATEQATVSPVEAGNEEEESDVDDSKPLQTKLVAAAADKSDETRIELLDTTYKGENDNIFRKLPPVVVEKRPLSLSMESPFSLQENTNVIKPVEEDNRAPIEEAVPAVLKTTHVEHQMERTFDNIEMPQSIEVVEEASPEIIEKTPVSLHMEAKFDEGIVENNAEADQEQNKTTDPVLNVEQEDGEMALQGSVEIVELKEETESRYIPEDAAQVDAEKESLINKEVIVIEKRPMSLHMEERVCLTEHMDVHEPFEDVPIDDNPLMKPSDSGVDILESSPVVIQKRPMSLHMEERVCHTEYHEREVQEPFEDVSIDDDAVTKPSDSGVQILESSPVVIQKRPMSLHMEERVCETEHRDVQEPFEDFPADEDAVTKPSDSGEEILESSPVVIQKRPMSLHMEERVCLTEHRNVQEPFEDFPADEDAVAKPSDSGVQILESSPVVIEKRPMSLHMEERVCVTEHRDVQEPFEDFPADESAVTKPSDSGEEILESSPVVTQKRPMSHHMEERVCVTEHRDIQEPFEDFPGYEGAVTKPSDSGEGILESSPVVIQKRPMSLHMEERVCVTEHMNVHEPFVDSPADEGAVTKPSDSGVQILESSPVVIQKRPMSLHMEERVCVTEHMDVQEPFVDSPADEGAVRKPSDSGEEILESSPVVIQKRPMSLHMEERVCVTEHMDVHEPFEDFPADEDAVTKPSDSGEEILESSPVVIQKRPMSLHMEERVCLTEHRNVQETFEDFPADEGAVTKPSDSGVQILEPSPVVIEKRPMSLHMEERVCATEHMDVQESFVDSPADEGAVTKPSDSGEEILESSPVVIEKRPMSVHTEERVCVTEHMEVQEPFEDVSIDDDAVTKPCDNGEEILESSPVVIQKRPMSLHMEERVCLTEHRDVEEPFEDFPADEGAVTKPSDSAEEILESSPVVIEKRPMSLHMEERVCVTEHMDVQEPFEDLPVDEGAVRKPSDSGEEILESSPVVIQKRPMSLHMEERVCLTEHRDVEKPFEDFPADEDAVTKPSDSGVQILESSPVVIEKRPMSLHMEERVCVTEHMDVQEPFEDVPVGDNFAIESPDSGDEILESPPLVVQNRPVSLHVEERVRLADDMEAQEPIEDAPPEIVVKRALSLHLEVMFDGDSREELVGENKVAAETEVMEAQYVDTESEKVEQLLKQAKELGNKERFEIAQPIEDALPVVLEKRPVSLHMESLFSDSETCESRKPIEETLSTNDEKTKPISLLYDHVFASVDKTSTEDELEAKVDPNRKIEVDEPKKDREEKELQDSELVVSHEDGGLEEHITFTEEEASPLLVQRKTFPLHLGSIFVQDVAECESELKNDDDDVSETSESTLVDDDLARVENALVPTAELVQEVENKDTAFPREPVQEVSPEVLEKRPLSLHMEKVFNEDVTEGRTEKTEDGRSGVERDLKSPHTQPVSEDLQGEIQWKTEELIEESPAFLGNRNGSAFHMEHTSFDIVVGKGGEEEGSVHFLETGQDRAEKEPEPDESIEETVAVVAEKRQESLFFGKNGHQEMVFKERDYENKCDEERDEAQVIIQRKENDEAQADEIKLEDIVTTCHMINVDDHQEENVEQGNNMQLETTEGDTLELKPNSDSQAIKTQGVALQSHESDEGHDKEPADVPPIEYDTERGTTDDAEVSADRILDTVELAPAAIQKPPDLLVELMIPGAHDKEAGEEKNQGNAEKLRVEEYEEKNHEVEESDLQIFQPKIQDVQHVVEPTQKCDEEVAVHKRVSNALVFGEENSNQNKESEKELKRENEGKQEIDEAKHQLEVVKTEETVSREYFEGGIKIQERVHETKSVEITTKTSRGATKENVSLTFHSKGFEEDAVTTRSDDHSRLARQVLKKRLSAPEVLPEKENEGSAPLAASEDRGILESQEQFTVETPKEAENTDTAVLNKDETPKAVDAGENVSPDPHDPESDVGGAGGKPDTDRPHLILIKAGQHRKQDKGIKEKKDETRGTPRATCCSLM